MTSIETLRRASPTAFGSTLLFALLAATPGSAQVAVNDLTLNPPLPNYVQPPTQGPTSLQALRMLNHRLTVGDLDGDGDQDLLFSNGLAFARAYFLEEDLAAPSGFAITGYDDVYPFGGWPTTAPACATSGPGARYLTVTITSQDTPVIYDIDLDGENELIYLDHRPDLDPGGPGEVHLQVWDHVNGSMVSKNIPPSLDLASIFTSNSEAYFGEGGPNCATAKHSVSKSPGTIKMRIANVRGRAIPQDIVVWGGSSYNRAVTVFGYDDNNGMPTITELFDYQTKDNDPDNNPNTPELFDVAYEGWHGHLWSAGDLNYDGKDEIVGKHTISYDPDSGAVTFQTGVMTKNAGSESSTVSDNVHPDHITIADFADVLPRQSNPLKLKPSPGIETIVSPQHEFGDPVSSDPSGPWIYQGLLGHDILPVQGLREWPLKILNIAETAAPFGGHNYAWPTINNVVDQPVSTGEWDGVYNDLSNANGTEDLDVQQTLVGDFISELSGKELLAFTKDALSGLPCNDRSYYLFDSTAGLEAQAWGNDGSSSNNQPLPGLFAAFTTDFFGDRSTVELHSRTFNPQDSCQEGVGIFNWIPDTDPTSDQRYVSQDLFTMWLTGPLYMFSNGGTISADVRSDSREELLIPRLGNRIGDIFTTSLLQIAFDSDTSVSRPEPSPFAYHSYRVRNQIDGFATVDFDELTGIRLLTGQRFTGTAYDPFGRLQAPELVPPLQTGGDNRSHVLVAEGGVAPYTFQLSAPLPSGLQSTPVLNSDYGDLFCIWGTPFEVGTKEIIVTITDSSPTPQVVDVPIWIKINAPSPPAFTMPCDRPRIYAGGFDGTVLSGSGTTSVPIEVWVEDVDHGGSALTVEVFDDQGALLGTLPHVNGDLYGGNVSVTHATGDVFSFQVVATDPDNQVSPTWPFVRIEGGPSAGQADLLDDHVLGQAAADTPSIDRVEFLYNTIPAAEVAGGTGIVEAEVHLGSIPAGQTPRYIEIQVTPPYEGVDPYKILWRWGSPANTSQAAKFFSSRGEFGWGDYGYNMRIVTGDGTGSSYYSDWWPQLLTH